MAIFFTEKLAKNRKLKKKKVIQHLSTQAVQNLILNTNGTYRDVCYWTFITHKISENLGKQLINYSILP